MVSRTLWRPCAITVAILPALLLLLPAAPSRPLQMCCASAAAVRGRRPTTTGAELRLRASRSSWRLVSLQISSGEGQPCVSDAVVHCRLAAERGSHVSDAVVCAGVLALACSGPSHRCCFAAWARSSLLLLLPDLTDARWLGWPPPSFFCLCLSRALGPAFRPALCACSSQGMHLAAGGGDGGFSTAAAVSSSSPASGSWQPAATAMAADTIRHPTRR